MPDTPDHVFRWSYMHQKHPHDSGSVSPASATLGHHAIQCDAENLSVGRRATESICSSSYSLLPRSRRESVQCRDVAFGLFAACKYVQQNLHLSLEACLNPSSLLRFMVTEIPSRLGMRPWTEASAYLYEMSPVLQIGSKEYHSKRMLGSTLHLRQATVSLLADLNNVRRTLAMATNELSNPISVPQTWHTGDQPSPSPSDLRCISAYLSFYSPASRTQDVVGQWNLGKILRDSRAIIALGCSSGLIVDQIGMQQRVGQRLDSFATLAYDRRGRVIHILHCT
ncbi:hypothetical protein F5Y18DRAFT_178825 [Xylariaceae sp. FL1019]|nr:hypothetical protein F5Y18DRAFT_178825 [Xylariaceae sp. FL1019]